MIIEEIVVLEPDIGDLLSKARKYRRFQNKAPHYEAFKRQLLPILGKINGSEKLKTSQVYETVIQALCDSIDY